MPLILDVSIRGGWFWHAQEEPRYLKDLVKLYWTSGTSLSRVAMLCSCFGIHARAERSPYEGRRHRYRTSLLLISS